MNKLLNMVVSKDLEGFKTKIKAACDTKFACLKTIVRQEIGKDVASTN